MYTEVLADALMWKEVLLLSCVKPSETVCVLTGANSNDRNFRAAMRAAQELGAIVFQLHIPPRLPHKAVGADRTAYVGVTPVTGNAAAIQTLKSVEFVVDLLGLLHSPEQLEILKSGTRMLMVLEPPEVLSRIMPTAGDKDRVLEADRCLRAAKIMHRRRVPISPYSLVIFRLSPNTALPMSKAIGITGPAASPRLGRTKGRRRVWW
jgi:2,5-dihydroxypyridine 5,6-dioxygenase